MTRNWTLLAAALVLAGSPARTQNAQTPDTNKAIVDFAKETSEIMANLEYLSDVIGPRLTGSAGLKLANDWTAEKMKSYGLTNVHLEKWTIPMGWERGVCELTMLSPRVQEIKVAGYAWGPNTPGTVEGPLVIFDPKDEADLERFKGKLKGAVVLRSAPPNINQHPSRDKTPARPIGGGMRIEELDNHSHSHDHDSDAQRPGRNAYTEFMEKEGVAAVLLNSGKPQMLLNMTGNWRTAAETKKVGVAQLFTVNEHYAMLWRLAKRGMEIKMRVRNESKFIEGPIDVYNTVGEIKGSEKPDEIVLCGAHLDSWDLANGTVDNGTGSTVTLEAARIITGLKLKPKRTIRFVLFSGEEQGLWGSKAYVTAHKDELAKHSAVFVHDTGTGRITGVGLHGNPQGKDVFEKEYPILKELGVERYSTGMMGGTDHASFYTSLVPGFFFIQDPADYNLMHHSQSDTFDKAIKEDLVQGATVMALCAFNVAQRGEMFPRRAPGASGTPADENPFKKPAKPAPARK